MGLLILSACGLWILWLLYCDVKERSSVSSGVWIVLAWAIIHATRFLGTWLGTTDTDISDQIARDEGNLPAAFINLFLIAAGLIIISRRRIRLPVVIRENAWLLAFYLFWFLSVCWSDYPVITLKRVFKDFGNVVMVLVVLTEREPGEAARAVFVRCAYLCIPLSLVLIRYVPDWGRMFIGYHLDTPMLIGVTENKNALGVLVMVLALFLLWDVLELRQRNLNAKKTGLWPRILVLMMCWYLLAIVDSVTSLVCAVFGSSLLIVLSLSAANRSPGRMEALGIGGAVFLALIDSLLDIRALFLQSLGRSTDLTHRTGIWELLSNYQDNPLVGAGFDTFWAGSRYKMLVDKTFGIIQAHNGYLETYLNGGAIGVGLLVGVLVSAYWRIRNKLVYGKSEVRIRFVLLLVSLIYNYTEASFNKLGSIMWLATVFAVMEYRSQTRLS